MTKDCRVLQGLLIDCDGLGVSENNLAGGEARVSTWGVLMAVSVVALCSGHGCEQNMLTCTHVHSNLIVLADIHDTGTKKIGRARAVLHRPVNVALGT